MSMLKKYVSDSSHILEVPPVGLKEDLSFKIQPVAIVDQEMKQVRSKVIPMVKVLLKELLSWRDDLENGSIYEEPLSLFFFKV